MSLAPSAETFHLLGGSAEKDFRLAEGAGAAVLAVVYTACGGQTQAG